MSRTDRNDRSTRTHDDHRDSGDDDHLLGLSFGGLLLLGGILLFVFPEPATSTVGIVLALVGAALLIADYIR